MSKKHWTQRAARAIQDDHSARYLPALTWVRLHQAAIEEKARSGSDEDGLQYGDRCVSEALSLYKASLPAS